MGLVLGVFFRQTDTYAVCLEVAQNNVEFVRVDSVLAALTKKTLCDESLA